MIISIVLSASFITTYFLPLFKCFQYGVEDENGIRPGGFELLLVFVPLYLPCFPVLDCLSVFLADPFLREPSLPVDLTPLF